MTQNNLQEMVKAGDLTAIAHLINRSLQKYEITATVALENGCLDVMLDHPKTPAESVAEFIHRGLLKLNIDPAYQATIYGRKTGEHFATWSQTFDLKPKPIGNLMTQPRNTLPSSASENQGSRSLTLTLSTEDGKTTQLDLAQLLGFLGSALLIVGVFTPIVSLPVVGTLSYFRNGSEEGIALIGLAIASIFCLVKGQYSWVYGTGLWSLLLVVLPFIHYETKLSELKSKMDRDLLGNPFRGLADAAMASVQLQWGWMILFLGAALVLTAAYLKKRNLDKQAFIAMGIAFAGVVALTMISPTAASIQYQGQAEGAKQSEARVYIGSINRSQQAYYLENNQFSSNFDALEIGVPSETSNYKYQIAMVQKDMTVATAAAKTEKLKSYTGAVFLTKGTSGDDTTMAIICGSDGTTQTPPATPTFNSGKPQCSYGSSEPNTESK